MMPEFTLDKILNTTLETAERTISLTVDERSRLENGVYTCELIVVDDKGVSSDPTTHTIEVRDRPVALISAPDAIGFMQGFEISGEESRPGIKDDQIVLYKWKLTQKAQ